MFDPKEYCEVCRELRAPEKKIEEIIAMTECVGRWRKERILLCVMFWIIGKELEKNVEKQREKSA